MLTNELRQLRSTTSYDNRALNYNAILAAFNNAIALPTTILYDSAGKEVWRIAGGVEWDDAEMAKLLRAAE
jgi:hypothetical protein